MVDPFPRQARTSVIVLLLVAVVSGLVVAGVYEVRARVAKRQPARSSDTDAPRDSAPGAPADDPGASARDGCADLRRRLLARCPGDLPVAPPAARQPPQTGSRQDEARAASDLAVWLNPPADELAEMAKHCEVRFVIPAITENQPPRLTDEDATALSLSNQERGLIGRTLGDMHKEFREFVARAYAEAAGPSAQGSAPTLEEMLADLQARPENGFEAAREKLARERAGVIAPPKPGTHHPPGERLLRRWATIGDELERQLSDGLGSERAHQLRFSPRAVWTRRFAESGCRSQP